MDSMVRVIFLLRIDEGLKNRLIKQSVDGKVWTLPTAKNKLRKVTDREMVDFAKTLSGWAYNVYSFGCSFIHLSKFHDYKKRDPLSSIDDSEKTAIKAYMQSYHSAEPQDINTFNDLVPYFPAVFDKISSNLESYLQSLEEGKTIDEYGHDSALMKMLNSQSDDN